MIQNIQWFTGLTWNNLIPIRETDSQSNIIGKKPYLNHCSKE